MDRRDPLKAPRPNMTWSDKLKMWLDPDTRTPEEKAMDEAIAQELESRHMDARIAAEVLGCRVVWSSVPKDVKWPARCSTHGYRMQPECRCVDPWVTQGIGGNEHAHFGPASHDPDESERCRAIVEYSNDLEWLIHMLQERWTDVAIESSGLNWTAATPIASVTHTDLKMALCLVALKSMGAK